MEQAIQKANGKDLVPELPEAVSRRGLNEAQWRTLMNSLYPGASSASVLMVVDYCIARKLDPLKKPCHIVPMQVKDAKSGRYEWRDVVMPGIYEIRTTAQRTGEYLGHSRPTYGPLAEYLGVSAPEWCEMTVYRAGAAGKAEFPVRVYFAEVVGTSKDKDTKKEYVNSRWTKAPIQMLTKCTEAAALREAFPNEIGGEHAAEELEGKVIDLPAQDDSGHAATATAHKTESLKQQIQAKRGRPQGSKNKAKEAEPATEPPAAAETSISEESFKVLYYEYLEKNPAVVAEVMQEQGFKSVDDLPDGSFGRIMVIEAIQERLREQPSS